MKSNTKGMTQAGLTKEDNIGMKGKRAKVIFQYGRASP